MNVIAPKRVYRQSARAAAAEATHQRIIDSFAARFRSQWFDEIRLDDVARDAGVTIQTVLRRFGSKEGLLDALHDRLGVEIHGRRAVRPGHPGAAIEALSDDYEAAGDLVLRLLAQEDRYPAIRAITDLGRASHRQWLADAFAQWLDQLSSEDRRPALDALVVACDVYVWKLVRLDMGRPVAHYRSLVATMCAAALGVAPEEIVSAPSKESSL